MRSRHPFSLASYLVFALSLISMAVLLSRIDTMQIWFSRASGAPANLIIDTQGGLGSMIKPWQHLAQGGESPDYRFQPAAAALVALTPQYIRLDHIYDFYPIVSRAVDGTLLFDWQKLDRLIGDITAVGAKPFISLSYMPPALNNGDVTGTPQNWQEWSLVVKATIEHISGSGGLNISDVYYEVWNEPDLFGQWKTYGSKNYLTLYEYAAHGASQALNTQPFKIGGPATTKLYDNWVNRFVDYTVKSKLRFDFFSWHHYTASIEDYLQDYERYDQLMRRYPDLILEVEPVISEWGFTPTIDPGYDTSLAAAHAVAVVSSLIPRVPKMFLFEFQDGKDPNGKEWWGKWGLLTHQDFGSHPKPRYEAIRLLNQLGPERLSVVGQGYWVKSLAAKKTDGTIQVIVANYDPQDNHMETVPITFQRLNPGPYRLTQQSLGMKIKSESINLTDSSFTYSLNVFPNAVILLELSPW